MIAQLQAPPCKEAEAEFREAMVALVHSVQETLPKCVRNSAILRAPCRAASWQ